MLNFGQGQYNEWAATTQLQTCNGTITVMPPNEMGLLATASVAIDGSNSKAVNNRDKKGNKTHRETEKLSKLKEETGKLAVYEKQMLLQTSKSP